MLIFPVVVGSERMMLIPKEILIVFESSEIPSEVLLFAWQNEQKAYQVNLTMMLWALVIITAKIAANSATFISIFSSFINTYVNWKGGTDRARHFILVLISSLLSLPLNWDKRYSTVQLDVPREVFSFNIFAC